tara:strand:- start:4883 stop:6151 length:1269 start_codon:yes stop_codon:yes gene_type:complete
MNIMKIIMKGTGLAVLLSVSTLAISASVIQMHVLESDSLKVDSRKGYASLTVWANESSNVITTSFARSLAEGGFISHDILDPIMNRHNGEMGYLGGSAGFEYSWTGKVVDGKEWSLCGTVGSELLVDTRWTSDAFELLWYGNGGHTGRIDILSGTGARASLFNRFSIGAHNNFTGQRLEISLIERLAGAEWSIPYGYLWVSDDADSLDTYLQTEGRIHALNDSTFLRAYGIGISGKVPLTPKGSAFRLDVDFRDLGILFEPEGSKVYWLDNGIATTGLPVLGDSLTWENIIDGNVSSDSVILTGNSVARMVLLPSKLSLKLNYDIDEDVMFSASISSGGWMPEPEIAIGLGWVVSEKLSWGVKIKDGGWGGSRPVVWAQYKVTDQRLVALTLEDPRGLFINSDTSDNFKARGISIRLQRAPD